MEQEQKRWGGKREGAGRKALPEGQKRVNLVVKIKPAIANELREIAKENKVSVSSIVENIIENNL
jgi:hypothetical protein